MNKPEVESYSAEEIWSEVEYNGRYLKGDQLFVTVEDHLAMLDYIKYILDGSVNENT